MHLRPVLWLALVGILLVPRPAHAGFWDIIWEMSGPQMIGFRLLEFELPLKSTSGGASDPRVFIGPLSLPGGARAGLASETWLWLVTEAYAYQSTRRKADELNLGPVSMISVDPMLAFGRHFNNRVRVHSGVGFSFNHLFGRDIHPLTNTGIKIRPIGVDHRFGSGWTLGVAYNLRVYPRGFEVGSNPPSLTKGKKSELVQGFVIELSY